jgi:hypothetical protein
MKKISCLITLTASAFMVLAMLGSCSSTPKTAAEASESASAQAGKTANKQRVADWKDRSLGEEASPAWLLAAERGDWSAFRSNWKIDPAEVLQIGASQGATLNAAQTIAEVQYAAHVASELKQTVLSKAAISLNSQGDFETVNDAATKTTVTFSGQQPLTNFWQEIETTDDNGTKKTVYNYYVVYEYSPDVWSQIVAKYLYDVVGQMPKTQAQKTMAGMFKEIDAATSQQQPISQSQLQANVQAQKAALASPMTPAQQYQAYKSGDPAQAAAAGTTSADTNYVAALSALANS